MAVGPKSRNDRQRRRRAASVRFRTDVVGLSHYKPCIDSGPRERMTSVTSSNAPASVRKAAFGAADAARRCLGQGLRRRWSALLLGPVIRPAIRATIAAGLLVTGLAAAEPVAAYSLALQLAAAPSARAADAGGAAAAGSAASAAPDSPAGPAPRVLGVGDAVTVQVYGMPDLDTTTYVADDGSIPVPLAGNVAVLGQSPAAAAHSVATAYRKGGFLVDPKVTLFLVQARSQQVSVLGAVRSPGRFVVESRTSLLDVLAAAGGIAEDGANAVVLLRPDKAGKLRRYPVDLAGLGEEGTPLPVLSLHGGDSIFVPQAAQFYISGEVNSPDKYRLETGMTVAQAVSRGGGITARGSSRKVEIRRRKPDGSVQLIDAGMGDPVRADDVIRVRERLF